MVMVMAVKVISISWAAERLPLLRRWKRWLAAAAAVVALCSYESIGQKRR